MQLDEGVVFQLVEMGFPMEACKKAVFNTNNSGVESAMNWVMEHMEDPGQCPHYSQRVSTSLYKYTVNLFFLVITHILVSFLLVHMC